MNKILRVVAVVLVVFVVARVGLVLTAHPSDRQQIQEELNRSIEASKEGRPGGVLDMISDKLTFNDQDASENIGQVAEFIKKQHPDVSVENPEPIVTGDVAQIVSPVDLKIDFLGQERSVHLKDVVMIFHREPATRSLVFPTSQWRLSEVKSQSAVNSNIVQ